MNAWIVLFSRVPKVLWYCSPRVSSIFIYVVKTIPANNLCIGKYINQMIVYKKNGGKRVLRHGIKSICSIIKKRKDIVDTDCMDNNYFITNPC